jgi:hypothetical protein
MLFDWPIHIPSPIKYITRADHNRIVSYIHFYSGAYAICMSSVLCQPSMKTSEEFYTFLLYLSYHPLIFPQYFTFDKTHIAFINYGHTIPLQLLSGETELYFPLYISYLFGPSPNCFVWFLVIILYCVTCSWCWHYAILNDDVHGVVTTSA